MQRPKRIAILASGSGTNAENIVRHAAQSTAIEVAFVLTNVRDAGVVERMHKLGISTFYVPDSIWSKQPEKVGSFLQKHEIDLVVLAGFMRKVAPELTSLYVGRMLNIHPSLLPAYGGPGMYGHHVHEAVIAAGESVSGVTVHQVTDVMDGGEIVAQQTVDVLADDTPASLEARIHEVEYELYPRAIDMVVEQLRLQDTRHPEQEAKEQEEPPAVPVAPPATPEGAWSEALGLDYSDEELVAAKARNEGMADAVPPQYAPQPPAVPYAGSAGNPCAPQNRPPAPPMPKNYLIWAVVMTVLCCMPAGVVAIVFAAQVSQRYYAGDYEGAERNSRRAQIWIIVSFVLGLLSSTIISPLMGLMG